MTEEGFFGVLTFDDLGEAQGQDQKCLVVTV